MEASDKLIQLMGHAAYNKNIHKEFNIDDEVLDNYLRSILLIYPKISLSHYFVSKNNIRTSSGETDWYLQPEKVINTFYHYGDLSKFMESRNQLDSSLSSYAEILQSVSSYIDIMDIINIISVSYNIDHTLIYNTLTKRSSYIIYKNDLIVDLPVNTVNKIYFTKADYDHIFASEEIKVVNRYGKKCYLGKHSKTLPMQEMYEVVTSYLDRDNRFLRIESNISIPISLTIEIVINPEVDLSTSTPLCKGMNQYDISFTFDLYHDIFPFQYNIHKLEDMIMYSSEATLFSDQVNRLLMVLSYEKNNEFMNKLQEISKLIMPYIL